MFNIEYKDEIALLRMQYGPANAMDVELCTALATKIRELAESDCRAIVLTGQNRIFCAGVDLPQLLTGGPDYVQRFLLALGELLETLFFCKKPLVAAVNGHAIAGGCLVTCCADQRLMVNSKAQIGVAELRVGVPFPAVALEIMRARTSPTSFTEVIFEAANFSAQDAQTRGLVDVIVEPEQLLTAAITAAETLARVRPEIFAFTKKQIRQPVREAIDSRSKLQEEELFALWESEETHAAVSGFVERTFKKV